MPNDFTGRAPGSPSVSVVVLNWNGGALVESCLSSVLAQEPLPSEVVVVDNGSSDGSLDRIRSLGGPVRMIELGTNRGYSAGMNEGIKATTGEFLVLLNLDVVLFSDYVRLCAGKLTENPGLGGVTGKLLRPGPTHPPILDTTGHLVYRSRRAVDRGEGEPDLGQYDAKTKIFGVCGAAPVYRRAMLEEIRLGNQYFDEDFFAYFEDFDLSWRARLAGWSFEFVPEAVGQHHRGATGAKAATSILAFNHVNRLFVMVKNDHPLSFLRHLPGIAYTELRATLHMLSRRPAALGKAWLLFFANFSDYRRKRRLIQSRRKVGWRELEPWFCPYRYGFRATLRRARRRRSSSAERLAR